MSEQLLPKPVVDRYVGTIVQEKYKILRKIGEGGMGAVYEGEHTLIRRRVAIKCLHSHFASNANVVARFHNEAMAANAIRHPNIVEVTDMGHFDDGTVFMVLELLEGHDLAHLITAERALPVGRVVHIVEQTCDALAAAHTTGIVHRDLKPENIFLLRRGDDADFVKVLDFGIAKFKEGLGQAMTRTGMAIGTPYYMAPEQAQGSRSVDHRSDIYSLGVILYNALTGHHPFEDESYPMLVVKILTQPPPALRELRQDLPDPLVALVARMLEKNPDARPQSCREVREALVPFRGITGVPVVAAAGGALPFAATQASGIRLSERPPVETPRAEGETRPIGTPEKWVEPKDSHSTLPGTKRPILLYAGLGAAVLGLAAIGLVVSGVLEPSPETVVTAEQATSTVEETTMPVPTTTPSPTGATEPVEHPSAPPPADAPTVRVQVTVQPDDAELFLDGNRVANPLDVDLPQSTEPRRLEARRDGYRTVVQDLVLVYAQRVTIDLRRGRGVDDQRRRGEEHTGMSSATSAAEMTETPEQPPAMTTEEAPTTTPEEESPTMMGGFLDLRGLTMMQ